MVAILFRGRWIKTQIVLYCGMVQMGNTKQIIDKLFRKQNQVVWRAWRMFTFRWPTTGWSDDNASNSIGFRALIDK